MMVHDVKTTCSVYPVNKMQHISNSIWVPMRQHLKPEKQCKVKTVQH